MPSYRRPPRRKPPPADAHSAELRRFASMRSSAESNADAADRLDRDRSPFEGPHSADGAERWLTSSRLRQQEAHRAAAQRLPGTADGAARWQESVDARQQARAQAEAERDAILASLADNPSGASVFAELESRLTALPQDLREELGPTFYEQRARAVDYRSQRDNELRAEGACNVTSLAMTLEQQGISVPGLREAQQPEDRLTELLEEALGLRLDGAHHPGHLYENRERLAEVLGARLSREWIQGMGAGGSQRFFVEQVLPLLQLGASASIGIQFTNRRGKQRRHIVRLQWVDESGITVDDPFGEAQFFGSGVVGWDGVDMNSEEAADAGAPSGNRGADNHWTYDEAAPIFRYIQWTSVPGTDADAALLKRV